ncbi:uncharacterized protein LOC129379936 isoform X2 [Poeciliopsis prolifica]|uniref:uncharacterized protein LOC129379936 isoform X2 n=1 Tax=Poeciliopsis prolifica TaxID=188132 RepID=UPI002413FE64|nr:uncharacterized protein LOC129379936 isoform X2 [Poeciliopsis prolifica]
MARTKEKVFCLRKWTRVMAFIMFSLHLCVSLSVFSIPENESQSFFPIDVNVTQKLYQAEKNHNITVDFTYTFKFECSKKIWHLICNRIESNNVFYQYIEVDGKKVSESQDDQFSGRVQCEKDVLKDGRFRLHLSRLRTEDSGHYRCDLIIGYCRGSDTFRLNVTEPHPSDLPPTIIPPPESRGWIGLGFGAAGIVGIFLFIYFIYRKKNNLERQPL